jgi:hypothetical protein
LKKEILSFSVITIDAHRGWGEGGKGLKNSIKHENRGHLPAILATPGTPLKEFAQNPKAPPPHPILCIYDHYIKMYI